MLLNQNSRAWAALAVAAALVMMTGAVCIPRPTLGPTVTVTATPTSGVAPLTVNVSATVTGGRTPYTYAWTANPASAATFADAAAASTTATVTADAVITCTVTDDNGRTDDDSETIDIVPPPLSVTASAPSSALGGETVNLVALVENETGAVSFSWLLIASGSAGSVTLANQNSQTASATFSADAAGTFTFKVTATDSAGSATDTVDIAVTPSGAGAATTFTAKTNDNLTGTAGDDIFDASMALNPGSGEYTVQTLHSGDRADGLAGNDVLNAEIAADVNPTIANIETFNITVIDAAATYDASKTTGMTTLNDFNSAGALTVSNLVAIPAVQMTDTGDQNLILGFAAAAVSGTADVLNLTLSGVDTGTFTMGAGVETVNLTSSGAAANVLADLNGGGSVTDLTIAGDQDLEITANLNTNNATLDTIDASSASGNLSLLVGAAVLDMTITGGSGDDRIEFSANFDDADVVDGGAGTDAVTLTNANAVAVADTLSDFTNIEELELSDGIDGALNLKFFGTLSKLTLNAAIAGNSTVTALSGTEIVVKASDGGAHTFGVTVTGTGTSDSLVLSLENGGTAFGGLTTLTGIESATINSTEGANTLTGLTFAPSAGVAAASVTITGDENLTMGTVTNGSPISATAFTGDLSLTLAQAGAVTGGSGADALTGSASADTIAGGAGDDTLNGGDGADALSGGEGDDTIFGGVGGDSDSLTGGDGTDYFQLAATAAANGLDTVNDFTADDSLDLNTLGGYDETITASAADTSTSAVAWSSLDVLVVTDADGSIDTAAEVAALFGAGAPFENPANGDSVAVAIQDTRSGGDTTVWLCVEGDADADFAAGECTQVFTLAGFNTALTNDNFTAAP